MGSNKTNSHEKFMRQTLTQARKGLGHTSPNPSVGCVIVQDGVVVAKDWHRQAGGDHAEILALAKAGDQTRGATLYVNLEPCCHAGRTGPCTDAIINAGVTHVVIAMLDPNPQVSGRGVQKLKEAGVQVTTGVLENEARELNEAFCRFITSNRPFVSFKAALTLDGKIATHSGSSKWITGEQARSEGHRLRGQTDAICVGVETILRDNPRLTVRRPGKKDQATLRIVFDSNLRTPPTAHVLAKIPGAPKTLICCAKNPNPDKALRLIDAGAEILEVPKTPHGLDLHNALQELAKRNVMHLLVEGGSTLGTSFIREQWVDKVHLFIAPRLIGSDGISVVGNLNVNELSEALHLGVVQTKHLGVDLLIEGYPSYGVPRSATKNTQDSETPDNEHDDTQRGGHVPREITRPAIALAAPNWTLDRW